jgi:hypothetical protein
MQPKHSLDRLLTPKTSGVHDLMSSFTAQPAGDASRAIVRGNTARTSTLDRLYVVFIPGIEFPIGFVCRLSHDMIAAPSPKGNRCIGYSIRCISADRQSNLADIVNRCHGLLFEAARA